MIKKIVTVINKKGLHARPSALLVKTALSFTSEIRLKNSNADANAKSVLDVMLLCAHHGTTLELSVDGEDEEVAAIAIEEVFTKIYED